MTITKSDLKDLHEQSKKICEDNSGFMLCPMCGGTKFLDEFQEDDILPCDYCNGNGIITWIDKILRGRRTSE